MSTKESSYKRVNFIAVLNTFKFSETIIFALLFLFAVISILDEETIQIYMTIIGIFFSRRAINSGTQLINCLLVTPICSSAYEKEKIDSRYNV